MQGSRSPTDLGKHGADTQLVTGTPNVPCIVMAGDNTCSLDNHGPLGQAGQAKTMRKDLWELVAKGLHGY